MTAADALPDFEDVLAAAERVRGVARETPILTHEALDALAGGSLFVKAECLQVTGSFKIRGAMNRLSQIPAAQRAAGVVAFSSGNHAQGVARAARLLGMPAIIVMPSDAPRIKVAGVEADGGVVHFYDRETESREEIATRIAEDRGAVVVPSFDDKDIVAGQGTAGLEFAHQMEAFGAPLDHLICCAGGGGLITGVAIAMAELSPQTSIWTAEPEAHDDWAQSLAAGELRSNLPGTRSICDAILTPMPGQITFALGKRLLSGGLGVSDDEVREAMRLAFRYLKVVAEPGGAAALAAAVQGLPSEMHGQRVGVLITGGNVDADMFSTVLRG
ncbi:MULTISPECIES: threonine ammonia-lyase [unclassified Hyphomonas]|uniref:threonine ammonia-lyase n=1 Tax=unclassified Hyphomonas TaxID=2630699 RepID=UPI000C47133C|nr:MULTISPECIES: threonine/serine dehydratase [unclassified Hyphomonas]MAA83452.1 pyridoxal-5'-phosphate-dependent protein [Hyphomonas sp.]MAN91175.1 pyridoxal-5'-phosphate-dependent protein [Hyphomonadaceae bacterium]HBL94801.1 pyridoxal-5'-phosphate-dependent protein [Hyphomonas sp.]|tara:strand:- start:7167 stop:8156 length:990 start_codon:yes stop_codon:yes gene_type:complete